MKMKPKDQKAFIEAARQDPSEIPRARLTRFLKECARWGVKPNEVLPLMRVPRRFRKDWATDTANNGVDIKLPNPATWLEIDANKLSNDTLGGWWARVYDGELDEDGNPIGRRRKWSEVRRLQKRRVNGVDRYFCPASNGVNYFPIARVRQIEEDPAVVGVFDIADENLPEPDATI